jgi:transcription-repair coupling factor (superfamily II helicase)
LFYLAIHDLKIRGTGELPGISKVEASSEAIPIQFVTNPPIDPMKIITLIQSKRHVKMAGQDKLRIELKYGDVAQRVLAIRNFFNELQQ